MDFDTLIGGEYKILLEPIAYYKFEGVMIATTATEAVLYDEIVGGQLRYWMGSLTAKNLPLSMFLETPDLGYPAWSGATNKNASNADIKSSLGLGIVRFEEQPEDPVITTYDYEYRVNTEVITAVDVSGGQSDPDTAVDAEKFCNEKSAIFVVLPEEDTTKYFMVSLIIQNLYREILTVADENGGRLKNRVVFFADELGSCPPIQSLELMFSASRSRGLMLVPIVQSITGQLQKNYGKEGSEIIVDNCQVNIFGGFAPASQTAEELSKALGSRTVMSGSISRGKNDPSQSLQMMERPLMTPDELKSMPKGSFIVAKTGVHPMRVRLRLFLDWGIRFGEPYEVPEKAQRPVAYADKQELEEAIIRRHYASSIEDEENQVDQGAAAAGGLSQGMRPEANRRKPALRP
jgi:hypothetical protein